MISIVKSHLRRILIALIRLFFYFFSRIKITYIRAIKEIKIKELNYFSKKNYKFILVFASYSSLLEDSTKQLLCRYRDGGGYIVLVSNHPRPIISLGRNEPIDVFIHNNGLGRDFGQFKIATDYIFKKIGKNIPEKVIYTNDSVFFVGDSRSNFFLDDLLNPAFDYVGLFENSGDGLRNKKWFASSWLFSTSKTLFLSKIYQDFFRKYIPYNLKVHAVLKGEVILSQVVLKFSNRVKIIFDNMSLINFATDFIQNQGIYEFMEYMSPSFKTDYFQSNGIINANTVISFLERNLYIYSPLHIFNIFLLSQRKFFYVKKDLFFSGNIEYNHFYLLEKSLFYLDRCHKLKLMRFFRLKGQPQDLSIYKRAKIQLGLD